MQFILGVIGLSFSFLGSAILAVNAIKSKKKILSESTIGRIPSYSADEKDDREKKLLEFPSIQSEIWQTKVASCGLGLLAGGFAVQLWAALL